MIVAITARTPAWLRRQLEELDQGRRSQAHRRGGGMSDEPRALHRIIRASVRDMLEADRIQEQAGPVTDKPLEEILFRASHGVVKSLAPYPAEQRAALLPNVVRLLLAAFLENVAKQAGSP